MKADPEKTVRIHDVVLDTWRRRHQDGQSQPARGSEREVLSNWRDKVLPNDLDANRMMIFVVFYSVTQHLMKTAELHPSS